MMIISSLIQENLEQENRPWAAIVQTLSPDNLLKTAHRKLF
jgi:hypothetical protein